MSDTQQKTAQGSQQSHQNVQSHAIPALAGCARPVDCHLMWHRRYVKFATNMAAQVLKAMRL
eukprot:4591521-Amphidinium_carterae.1